MSEDCSTQLKYSRELNAAGISTISVGKNKVPNLNWKQYQNRLPTDNELKEWHAKKDNAGIGVVCGAISGNLEVIDIDPAGDTYEARSKEASEIADWTMSAIEKRSPGLSEKLAIHRTPSGGNHILYRCQEPVEGNQKLAEVPTRNELDQKLSTIPKIDVEGYESKAGAKLQVLSVAFQYLASESSPKRDRTVIETRGEGGYVVGPHSPVSCGRPGSDQHYEHVAGPKLAVLQPITEKERDILLNVCRQFNVKPSTKPAQKVEQRADPAQPSLAGEVRPGDDFSNRVTWADILEPAGFTHVGNDGDTARWRRPGTKSKLSATTNSGGSDLFYPFSPNCGMEPNRGYNRFSVYALLNHDGDMSRAAEELARQGYGSRPSLDHIDIDEALDGSGIEKIENEIKSFPLFRYEEFLELEAPENYLCEQILIAGESCVIGGKEKTCKTTIAIDLLLSIGSATRFLNRFDCPKRETTGFLTGESGIPKLQRSLKTIMASKQFFPLDDTPEIYEPPAFLISQTLPDLSSRKSLEQVKRTIEQFGLKVLALDPMYLCLGSAAELTNNVSAMGNLLRSLDEISKDTGCTIIVLHHTNRKSENNEPLTLRDLSGAGLPEWARQWILLSTRTPFDPDTHEHKLWMVNGGSAGHAGKYAIDICEKDSADDWAWNVSVRTIGQEKAEHQARKIEKKAESEKTKSQEFVANLRKALNSRDDGSTINELKRCFQDNGYPLRTHITADKMGEFVEAGFIKADEATRGNNQKITAYFPAGTWIESSDHPAEISSSN